MSNEEQVNGITVEKVKEWLRSIAARATGAFRSPHSKYVLLTKELSKWGRVPQQQIDIAAIIAEHFEIGQVISEADLFAAVTADAHKYPQLANSVQDPTSGMTNDGNS